ncbi:hypothetical protein [Microbacterium sp. 22242]|uniref:hypothetical protein n=1 Tax=Microbacterium sp. 22242 TaxID=3453896 RepID=UPI003F83D455
MADPLAPSPSEDPDSGRHASEHLLPPQFTGTFAAPGAASAPGADAEPEPPRAQRSRRRVLAWTLSVTAVALLAAGFTAVQISAAQGFDAARTSLNRAESGQDAAVQQVRAALTRSDGTAKIVDAVLAVQSDLITPADRTALTAADDRGTQETKAANALIPARPPAKIAKPFWFWDAQAAAGRLRTEAADARKNATALSSAEKKVEGSVTAVQAAGSAALISAADRAAAAEAANVPATNESVLALRSMVTQVKSLATPLQDRVTTVYPALVLAVQKLQDSHAATLAAEAGPLEDSRLQLEAFARSLAPGVLMDFEWADLVNGKGGPNDYLSGETAWWYDQGGYATIRLSNSIAEDWPSDAAHAIVAHEVGHAITVRCRAMYDTTNAQTAEAWATAWAISMGYTDDANGTSAYGAPPESLIQTASSCR